MLIVQMCRKINNINVQKQWGFSYEKLKIIKLYRKLKLYQHCEKHFLEIICFYHISNIFSWIYCIITLTSHLTNASKNTKRQLSQNTKYKITNIQNTYLKKLHPLFVLLQSKNSYDPNRTVYKNTIREKIK